MTARRVLISTISARNGGVPVMVNLAVDVLRQLGAEPVIAYYEPYSLNPSLSVPSFALGTRRPAAVAAEPMLNCETHAIGAWLPELEFTTYRLHRHWQAVIESCSAHVAVSGNILAALPLAMSGVPYLAWIASDWHGDRVDRVRQFGAARRLLDAALVRPVTRRSERRLLRTGQVVALSRYTAQRLASLAAPVNTPAVPVCPIGIDTALFLPAPARVEPGHIVFSGRSADPRKNIDLLLAALRVLASQGTQVRLTIVGGGANSDIAARLQRFGVHNLVRYVPHLNRTELVPLLSSADVFALPSHQEGLCIAALEAMACGAPVVSTRCGGPEEFVLPGVNGELVDFDADAMALALEAIVTDRARHTRYSAAARDCVQANYSMDFAQAQLRRELLRVFPALASA